MKVGVHETMDMILALCKLHNFSLDDKELHPTAVEDVSHVFREGGMLLPRIDGNGSGALWDYNEEEDRLNLLLDGGDHSEDYEQQRVRKAFKRVEHLPYKVLLTHVVENKYTRPDF